MTPVIGGTRRRGYAGRMPPPAGHPSLAALLAEQQELEARLRSIAGNPGEALDVGKALLAFAAREDSAFARLAALLDPVAQQALADEHRQVAEDLQLLGWLLRTSPDSPDVEVLTGSLLTRMREHVHRDGRLLARAVALSDSASSSPPS